MTTAAERVVLVGGHESADGRELVRFAKRIPGSAVVTSVRTLDHVVALALGTGETVFVVPMTFGRDQVLIADAARSSRWARRRHRGRIALTAPFGTVDHLAARLRSAAAVVQARDPGAALVVAARAADPYDEAELHRIAHLVRVHGAGVEVMVANLVEDSAVGTYLARLRLLGFDHAVVVPAGFAKRLNALPSDLRVDGTTLDGMTEYGPIMSDSAVVRIVAERVHAARQELKRGHDGIADGLVADHAHGYAHSHEHERTLLHPSLS